MRVCVVGSGPSGVSVATALLKKGYDVTILDYGNDISNEKAVELKKMAALDKQVWTKKVLSKIKYPIRHDMENKLAYGENYPYREGLDLLNIKLDHCGLHPSLAAGGLSNVWGGAMLPYIDKDIIDWPINIKDLETYYKELNSILSISTYSQDNDDDDLTDQYPMYSQTITNGTYDISHQIKQFRSTLKKNAAYTKKQNLSIGYSRNAFDSKSCIRCGLCMWGCPHQFIYNSKHTLENLKKNEKFHYKKVLVKSFIETETGKVKIITLNKKTNEEEVHSADKLFLASGVLATAKIVLQSLNWHEPIQLHNSPHFIFPLIDLNMKGNAVEKIDYNTLSQLFIEINNEKISQNTVHIQVYPYNDMMMNAFENKLGNLFFMFYPILKLILNKTIILQGFLHSNESEKINLQLQKNGSLQVTGTKNKYGKKIKDIVKIFSKFGIIPIHQISIPGRSYHCGGTFPMTKDENAAEDKITTNELGLIRGLKNVHIVDASILPSIPAQTVTYTVMANAYRIGSNI
jgi:choline dehydrogenase-like flavoprotein